MLRLSAIKAIDDTLDKSLPWNPFEGGGWTSPVADEILTRWGYGPGLAKYFRSSANHIFVFREERRTYWLRFIEQDAKPLHRIEGELAILQYLHNSGLRVALPVVSTTGRVVEMVQTQLGSFNAALFCGLQGRHYEVDELASDQFATWGNALGRLHRAFKAMPEPYGTRRPSWRDRLDAVQERLPSEEAAARREWMQLAEWAARLPADEENYGMVHYDFELDNLRWHEGSIGMLDFDDCTRHWYAADIAYALRDLYDHDPAKVDSSRMDDPRFARFVDAYRQVTSLEDLWLDDLSWFARMGRLISFVNLLHVVDLDDPGPLGALQKKLLAVVARDRAALESIHAR